MSVHEKLMRIQVGLKAPKSRFNKFGGYHHRALEDIYEGVKPLLLAEKCSLRIDNDIVVIKDILFRKSIATLRCVETNEEVAVTTFTQEGLEKKGMTAEQCSGSTASYSDKYCLNKLFCIDDVKDADDETSNNTKENDIVKKPVQEVKPVQEPVKPVIKPEVKEPIKEEVKQEPVVEQPVQRRRRV